MTLRHEPRVSVAEWIVADGNDADARNRALQGPPGFAAYATVWFDDEDADPYRSDAGLVATATRLAADHTFTPDDAWFALWEGWGELEHGRIYSAMQPDRAFGRFFAPPRPQVALPAFDRSVLDAPRVDLLGQRSYLLFTGRVGDVGDWGARPLAPGWPRELPQAALTWPADHAWCITSDVDATWFCIGGSQALVDAAVANPDLSAEPTTYGDPPRLAT
ncbi:hypothetical protein ACHAAC_12285 [Aeromicrobium sp. CF4.19]|uniref:hypothetical protein n=1 Tax=Aeromicrobium sp. CF4.19 TaxID=3373082 RepID=UPI003EE78E0A